MDSIQTIFQRKAVVWDKLVPFGFTEDPERKNTYRYHAVLPGSGFEITVTVSERGDVSATVVDPDFNEPYTLHLRDEAVGGFVGEIRTEYEEVLSRIADACFEPDVFKSMQAKQLIEYVRTTYGDELEYLWTKFPDNAVWRRKDTTKWYGALLTVAAHKLGLASDEMVEIIDLRLQPECMADLIDHRTYFPGWHMNKKSWYTIILNGSVSFEELCRRIDTSYELATK